METANGRSSSKAKNSKLALYSALNLNSLDTPTSTETERSKNTNSITPTSAKNDRKSLADLQRSTSISNSDRTTINSAFNFEHGDDELDQILKEFHIINNSNSATNSTISDQKNIEEAELIQRKMQISDLICDFIYCGSPISPEDFLKLQNERMEIYKKLQKLRINPSYLDTEVNETNLNHQENSTIYYENDDDYNNEKMGLGEINNLNEITIASPTLSESVNKQVTLPGDEVEPEYPWSNDVIKALREVFGLSKFRHNQLKAINATLKGQDVFVLMPTGGGKSLCYQLPALIESGKTKGVNIVISPLISLVQDQIEKLDNLGIGALALNSHSTINEKQFFKNNLSSSEPTIKIIYITPEMLIKSGSMQGIIRDLYIRNKLARFTIDEAHCVSQWGHDFRPDYKKLGFLKHEFPDIPIIALTATANLQVEVDVIQNLHIKNCLKLVQSFNRKNLTYEVRHKNKDTVLFDIYTYIIENHQNDCGIIYCKSKKDSEKVAKALRTLYNLKAHHYHASMSKHDRQKTQHDWQVGEINIIVATIAFGMGIDKANVRFVIHHSLPRSIESYYQETGRAGRDGKNSNCLMYFSAGDIVMLKAIINIGQGTYDSKINQRDNLIKVVSFCENMIDCRRQQLLAYFGEYIDSTECNKTCDNCIRADHTTLIDKDVTILARKLVQIVTTINRKISLTTLLRLFKGDDTKKLEKYNLSPKLFGCGKKLPNTASERLVSELIARKVLQEVPLTNWNGFTCSTMETGPSVQSLINGTMTIIIPFNEYSRDFIPNFSKYDDIKFEDRFDDIDTKSTENEDIDNDSCLDSNENDGNGDDDDIKENLDDNAQINTDKKPDSYSNEQMHSSDFNNSTNKANTYPNEPKQYKNFKKIDVSAST